MDKIERVNLSQIIHAPGSVTVSINVNVQGPPDDSEKLAQAVLRALRVLVPNVSVG